MRFALQVCGWLIGLPLELLIIAALLRGGFRRFPLVFAYTIADFLTTVVELPSNVGYVRSMPWAADAYAAVYWVDEAILQVLVYAVVMSLIYQATGKLRSRRIVRASLIAGAILFAGISFLIHRNPALNVGSFMTPWIRDLNFCSADSRSGAVGAAHRFARKGPPAASAERRLGNPVHRRSHRRVHARPRHTQPLASHLFVRELSDHADRTCCSCTSGGRPCGRRRYASNPALLFELLGPVGHHRDGRRAGPLQRQFSRNRWPSEETS